MDAKTIELAKKNLSRDPVMKKLIETIETPVWSTDNNLFFDLLDAIISQQLSVKAGATILGRFIALFASSKTTIVESALGKTASEPKNKVILPEEILEKPDEVLRAAGLSNAKVRYVKALSQAIVDKTLDLKAIHSLSDQEVITELTKVKGIGKWTAEMILIFSLHRPDVFSVGDLGLRSAVSKLYGIEREGLTKIEELSRNWSPYRSVASRYLWRSLDNEPKI